MGDAVARKFTGIDRKFSFLIEKKIVEKIESKPLEGGGSISVIDLGTGVLVILCRNIAGSLSNFNDTSNKIHGRIFSMEFFYRFHFLYDDVE